MYSAFYNFKTVSKYLLFIFCIDVQNILNLWLLYTTLKYILI